MVRCSRSASAAEAALKTWSRSISVTSSDSQAPRCACSRIWSQDGVLVADEVLVAAAGVAGLQGGERALAGEGFAGTDVQEEHQVRFGQVGEDLFGAGGWRPRG